MLFLSGCDFLKNDSVLIIKNSSDFVVTDVKLLYSSSKKNVDVGNIAPSSIYKYLLDSPLQEDSIKISYKDTNKILHEDIAVAYMVKGSGEDYKFEIK